MRSTRCSCKSATRSKRFWTNTKSRGFPIHRNKSPARNESAKQESRKKIRPENSPFLFSCVPHCSCFFSYPLGLRTREARLPGKRAAGKEPAKFADRFASRRRLCSNARPTKQL